MMKQDQHVLNMMFQHFLCLKQHGINMFQHNFFATETSCKHVETTQGCHCTPLWDFLCDRQVQSSFAGCATKEQLPGRKEDRGSE